MRKGGKKIKAEKNHVYTLKNFPELRDMSFQNEKAHWAPDQIDENKSKSGENSEI